MHGTKLIAVLALATSSVMAHTAKVTFRRFTHDNCNETFHIGKDTHLEDPHCKTFDHDEPPFLSFQTNLEDGDVDKNLCSVTVFEQPGCIGNGFTMDDLQKSQNTCGNTGGLPGRSALVRCEARKASGNVMTSSPSKAATSVSTVVHTSVHVLVQTAAQNASRTHTTTTKTVTRMTTPTTLSTSTTTITLVPEPTHHHCHEVCDDE